jgi:alanine racemase
LWDILFVNMADLMHPAWIEVNQLAIAHNVRTIKKYVGDSVRVMAVVKGNAYGHGMIEVARNVLANGADWVATAYMNEAVALREAGIAAPILVMAYTPASLTHVALQNDLAVTISDIEVARRMSEIAVERGETLRAHLKIDTGMSRLGVHHTWVNEAVSALEQLQNLKIEGVMTHFSSADTNPSFTREQLDFFKSAVELCKSRLPTIQFTHAANSAGTLNYPEAHFDMVRPGVALYGLTPFEQGWGKLTESLIAALTWKARVALVKTLPAHTPVSYGGTFVTTRETRVAVIPVGYADGFRRAPYNAGFVLVRGQRAQIIGRVCMDQFMIDVTRIRDVKTDDEVVLLGAQDTQRISAEDIAKRIGTINYEVTTSLLTRIPRVSV